MELVRLLHLLLYLFQEECHVQLKNELLLTCSHYFFELFMVVRSCDRAFYVIAKSALLFST